MPPPLPPVAMAPLTPPAALEPWAPPGTTPAPIEQTPVVVVQSAIHTPVVSYSPLTTLHPLPDEAPKFSPAVVVKHSPVAEPAPAAVAAAAPVTAPLATRPLVALEPKAPIHVEAPVHVEAPIHVEAPVHVEAPIHVQPPSAVEEHVAAPATGAEEAATFPEARLAEPSIVEEAEIVARSPTLPMPLASEPAAPIESAADSEPTAVIQPPPAREPVFEPAVDSEPTAVFQPPANSPLVLDNEPTTVFQREALTASPEAEPAEAEPSEPAPPEQAAAFAPWPSIPPLPAVEPATPAAFSEPSFTSSGSEMPVVLQTPVPHRRERAPLGLEQFWQQRSEWLPRAHTWSQKTLRNAPRALIVTAPFIALFGIWAAHSLIVHHRHANNAQAPSAAVGLTADQTAHATAAALEPAQSASASPPSVLATVGAVADKPSTAAPAAPAAALADPAELVHALTHGLPALEALSAEFPGDAQVAVALASQQAQAQRFEAAVSSVQHALEIDPSSGQNGKVMSILWRAAQSSASEQSFLALRKLGARGSDIAFDLATTPGVRDSVRERARSELSNFLAFDASPDTRVATAMLLAPDCSTRKGLLDRAGYEGGKRTASMLERISRGGGCTTSTDGACNACMMGSPVLAHALSKLNAGARP